MPKDYHFLGFQSPNYTQVPDEFFDELAPNLTEAELRVAFYVIRRTFGFKKSADTISLTQLISGIRTKDGRVLDRGTGMSKHGVSNGLKGLLAKGVIIMEKGVGEDGSNLVNLYALRYRDGGIVPVGDYGGSPRDLSIVPAGDSQETVKQQTDDKRQLSNNSKKHMTISELEDAEKKQQEIERWTRPERFRS